ncbi:MAG: ABC transporter permease [Anaerolineales bacterium]|nr:ABC transporter permease [Anaerolineales bacterium]
MTASNSAILKDEWDLIIRPQRNWWDLHLDDLWRYRDLIQLLVWRDFVAYYKQTILGPLWYIIQPVLTTVVFTVIFGNIAKLSTDGLPVRTRRQVVSFDIEYKCRKGGCWKNRVGQLQGDKTCSRDNSFWVLNV